MNNTDVIITFSHIPDFFGMPDSDETPEQALERAREFYAESIQSYESHIVNYPDSAGSQGGVGIRSAFPRGNSSRGGAALRRKGGAPCVRPRGIADAGRGAVHRRERKCLTARARTFGNARLCFLEPPRYSPTTSFTRSSTTKEGARQ